MTKGTETFVYATYIRTTPEKLWEALTNGDFTEKYWMGFRFEADLKKGGSMRILPPKGMEEKGDHAGTVLACDPPRKLSYTWNMKVSPEVAKKRDGLSRVTYELTPMGQHVKLSVIHENLLPEEFRSINGGWPAVMSSLKSLLETGEALTLVTNCQAESAAT